MVIRNRYTHEVALFEIKHSRQRVRDQGRHLRDIGKLDTSAYLFGNIAGRYILYLGEDCDDADGIRYRNVEKFLKNLPDIMI